MSSNRQKINSTNTFLQRKRSIKSKEISIKPKMGTWDESEDKKLRDWVKKNGAYNWTICAEYMKNRTAKQCREHWKNTIDDNLIKGQWTAEEDLLIMKFYEKYGSWRKMIPMFENRTENSIKNRFFSQLRKIVVKQRPPNGKKEYGTKYGLDTLKKYLNEGIKQAEKRYFEENKNMTKADFENYMVQIENLIKNRKKGVKFIDIKSLKRKSFSRRNSKNNIINIKEEEDDKNEQLYNEEKEDDIETFNSINKKRGRKKEKKNNIFKTERNQEEENVTREDTSNIKDNKFNFGKKRSKSKIINFQRKSTKDLDIIKENNETTLESKKSKKDIEHNEIPLQRKKSKKDIEHNEIPLQRKTSKKDIEPIIKNEENKRMTRQNSKLLLQQRNSRSNIDYNYYNNFLAPFGKYEYRINNMTTRADLNRSESNISNENEDFYEAKQKNQKDNYYLSKTTQNINSFMDPKSYNQLQSFDQSGDILYKPHKL